MFIGQIANRQTALLCEVYFAKRALDDEVIILSLCEVTSFYIFPLIVELSTALELNGATHMNPLFTLWFKGENSVS